MNNSDNKDSRIKSGNQIVPFPTNLIDVQTDEKGNLFVAGELTSDHADGAFVSLPRTDGKDTRDNLKSFDIEFTLKCCEDFFCAGLNSICSELGLETLKGKIRYAKISLTVINEDKDQL